MVVFLSQRQIFLNGFRQDVCDAGGLLVKGDDPGVAEELGGLLGEGDRVSVPGFIRVLDLVFRGNDIGDYGEIGDVLLCAAHGDLFFGIDPKNGNFPFFALGGCDLCLLIEGLAGCGRLNITDDKAGNGLSIGSAVSVVCDFDLGRDRFSRFGLPVCGGIAGGIFLLRRLGLRLVLCRGCHCGHRHREACGHHKCQSADHGFL